MHLIDPSQQVSQMFPLQGLTREIVDKKLDKLKEILREILTFNGKNISILKNLSEYVLKKFHKPIYYHSIFKGSFWDPYRHVQLTFMVGNLECKFKNEVMKNRTAQINNLYKAMVKIEKIPECNLLSIFDIQLNIIKLLVTDKNNLISLEKFCKIRPIFYAYRREDICNNIASKQWRTELPKLTSQETAQEEINCLRFNQIVSSFDFSRIQKLPAHFEEEKLMDIASYITNYNYKIFSDIPIISFDHRRFIKSCKNITSINLNCLDDIKYISYPEKIIKMKIKDNDMSLYGKIDIIRKFINIEILKIHKKNKSNNFLTCLPNIGNLRKLSCRGDIGNEILVRLRNIESFHIHYDIQGIALDLSLLLNPNELKHLNYFALTSKEFSKFINIESFTFPFPLNSKEEKKIIELFPPTLKKITFSCLERKTLENCSVCPNIETIKLLDLNISECDQSFTELTELIVTKFPALKIIKLRKRKEPGKTLVLNLV